MNLKFILKEKNRDETYERWKKFVIFKVRDLEGERKEERKKTKRENQFFKMIKRWERFIGLHGKIITLFFLFELT